MASFLVSCDRSVSHFGQLDLKKRTADFPKDKSLVYSTDERKLFCDARYDSYSRDTKIAMMAIYSGHVFLAGSFLLFWWFPLTINWRSLKSNKTLHLHFCRWYQNHITAQCGGHGQIFGHKQGHHFRKPMRQLYFLPETSGWSDFTQWHEKTQYFQFEFNS